MKYGVVYKFRPHKKLNGTLFYCYEYCQFLRQFVDAKLYIVGISGDDLKLVTTVFAQKYNCHPNSIVALANATDLYKLNLTKTVILDVKTFGDVRGLLTNEILCFSNEPHAMFRYSDSRHVTYFGSYDYQNFDVFSYLKLNFDIFQTCQSSPGVFISSPNSDYIAQRMGDWVAKFCRPVYLKQSGNGLGDIFNHIDSVHYVHTSRDTNNRIIPEAFWHNKCITIEQPWPIAIDSILLRYNDVMDHGLANYTLTQDDEIITSCLQ